MEISTASPSFPAHQERSDWASSIRRTFPEHIPLYVCAILFIGATFVTLSAYDVPVILDAGLVLALITALALFGLFIGLGLLVGGIGSFIDAIRDGSPHPIRAAARWAARQFNEGDRIGNSFHAVAAFVPLLASFDLLKQVIPRINPFSWDTAFSSWDRFLGFGRMPWEWLQPFLGHPPITAALAMAYDMWFMLIFASLLWEGF
jgi:hypothetical protein